MKPKPRRSQADTSYPTLAEHRCERREFLSMAGKAALGAAVAGATFRGARAGEEASAASLEGAVAKLAGQLSHGDFKTRESATRKLIEMGCARTCSRTGKKLPATTKQAVVSAMEKLKKHDDPEVSQRAKRVLLAVAPKPTPPAPAQPIQLDGDIAIGVE